LGKGIGRQGPDGKGGRGGKEEGIEEGGGSDRGEWRGNERD